MKQYVCSICGYVHDEAVGGKWEDLPADWKCPVCKAGKDAFKPKEEKTASQEVLEKPHVDKELSPMEMSIICSNLARGCEKQYLPEQEQRKVSGTEYARSRGAKFLGFTTIGIGETDWWLRSPARKATTRAFWMSAARSGRSA